MLRRTLIGSLVTLSLILLSSCGPRVAGYGVVLWGEAGGTPKTGDVVPVSRDTPINAMQLIVVAGERTPREFPAGRMRVFKKRADAAAFSAGFADFKDSWAVVIKQDDPPLPIRETASQKAAIVYKLQRSQLVKVVSRSKEMQAVDAYRDYWYEVATEDGFLGWCFGHYLKPFAAPGDPSTEARRVLALDETLDRLMATTWRPDWFRAMLGKGIFDLTVFREDVGLFPSPAEKLVTLVLPLSTFEFRYTDIQKVGAASYQFIGTDLRIDVLDEERINVNYRYKDQPVKGLYAIMVDDVAQIIAGELKRREDLYAALLKKGTTLTSSAYGTIRLEEGMRFWWTGFGKLVPTLIGSGAKGRGAVDFSLHVAKELSAEYDGAITFLFDELPANRASFLSKTTADGVRLSSLGKNSVQDLVVTSTGLSPVVIFFAQSP
jgi:hypothetical protein